MTEEARSDGPRIDLAPLQACVVHLDAITHAQWARSDRFDALELTNTSPSRILDALADLEPISSALVDVRVVGTREGSAIELRRVGSIYEVVRVPEAPPENLFGEQADLDLARRAWDRDSDAALKLPMSWEVRAQVRLDRVLDAPDEIEVRVVRSAASLDDQFNKTRLSGLEQLLPVPGKRRVYVALGEPAGVLNLGSLTFMGYLGGASQDATHPRAPAVPSPSNPLPGERSDHLAAMRLPLPVALMPMDAIEDSTTWSSVGRRCASLAAVLTWIMLASDMVVDGDAVTLDFRGLKRLRLSLRTGDVFDSGVTDGARRLRAWVFHDASPDRLLAVRQVASLYDEAELLHHADDVLASSELVYVGLRSEAVAEVVRGARDAQSETFNTVRQALRGVQDLAKSAAERLLAALVGIGAVVIANSGETISDSVGRGLMIAVALFLLALAGFSLAIEGPLLALPLKKLDDDFNEGTPLLAESQRKRLVNLPSVTSAMRLVLCLRIVVPCIYVGLAILIFAYGYPGRYH